MSFHSHSKWHWERLPDGGVRVTHPEIDPLSNERVTEHRLTANEWASIVASVSAGGEVAGRFYTALAFHSDKGGGT